MKYNRANIMKRAWEIKKEDNRNIFSECLKLAWAEAKKTGKIIFNLDMKYGDYKNIGDLFYGICVHKNEYNAKDKTINLDITVYRKSFRKGTDINRFKEIITIEQIRNYVRNMNLNSGEFNRFIKHDYRIIEDNLLCNTWFKTTDVFVSEMDVLVEQGDLNIKIADYLREINKTHLLIDAVLE